MAGAVPALRRAAVRPNTKAFFGETIANPSGEVLDVENVAEEIESVGRSELAAVESQLHNTLVHLMKLVAEPEAFHGAVATSVLTENGTSPIGCG